MRIFILFYFLAGGRGEGSKVQGLNLLPTLKSCSASQRSEAACYLTSEILDQDSGAQSPLTHLRTSPSKRPGVDKSRVKEITGSLDESTPPPEALFGS